MEVEHEKKVDESPKETMNDEEEDEMKKYVGGLISLTNSRWDRTF